MSEQVCNCVYRCPNCEWKGFVRVLTLQDQGRLVYADPANPNEVCPQCMNPLETEEGHYSLRFDDHPLLPFSSFFAMVPGGPAHHEDLWRWILGGDVTAGVTDESEIIRRRLELATQGYDLFARSQNLGSVITVEAWEPPVRSEKPFEVILYRRSTGQIIQSDSLPGEETMPDEVLEYVARFKGL